MKKIFQVNQGTGIRERPNIIARDDPLFNRSEPPTVAELDQVFRTRAVDLVAKACRKAIADWGGTTADITHTVAATGTNAGNPGYDLLVTEKIGVRAEAQRVLLNGIGCAGGLAAIRVAASIANDATLRGRPARILGFCCELTSTNVRADLQGIMENPNETKVAMTLFSDAGGSFVICNSRGLENPERAIFSVLDWESGILQGTQKDMQFFIDPLGKKFPLFFKKAVDLTLLRFPLLPRPRDTKHYG
jgi:type III polyketide synthase